MRAHCIIPLRRAGPSRTVITYYGSSGAIESNPQWCLAPFESWRGGCGSRQSLVGHGNEVICERD